MKRLAMIAALPACAILFGVVAYFNSHDEAFLEALLYAFLMLLVVVGIAYFTFYFKSMRKLDLPRQELDDEEVIWAKTHQSMVHYESGNPLKFWEAVGGKLFLTNQVLEFRSNPAEFFAYRITIPLTQVVLAEPCRLFGLIPGALRVWRDDGTKELFTFGAALDMSQEWADAIMAFRDDLEEGAGRGDK